MLIEQKVPNTLDDVVKHMCQGMGDKSPENSETSMNLSEDSGGLVIWNIQEILSKVKENYIMTKKKA